MLLQAQKTAIQGTVMATDSVTPLQGVDIFLEQSNMFTTSNSNGVFTLVDVADGNYNLICSAVGYSTQRITVQVQNGLSSILNIYLKEQINQLNEVVVMSGGDRSDVILCGSVQYISPKEIEAFSYSDVNRVLRLAPGINLQEEDGFGLRPNIGLRGTGVERSSKITIMEDGVLIAPAPYADPAAYYFPTIGRMKAVEILKGSSQIQYGPFTTGGAINFISTPILDDFAVRVHATAGSFQNKNLHAYVSNQHKNIGYLVETFQYGSDGFKTLENGGNTGFDKEDYLVKLKLNTNPDVKMPQSILFKVGQTNEQSNETYLGLTANDFAANPFSRYAGSQMDNIATEQHQYSATHHIDVSKNVQLTTVAYATDFKRNWYKLDKVADSSGVKSSIANILESPEDYNNAYQIIDGNVNDLANTLYVRANNRAYLSRGVQTELRYKKIAGMLKHDVSIGARLHTDEVDRFQWDDEYTMVDGIMQLTKPGTPGTESNRIKSADAFAAYAQYQLSIKKWTITPGLRFEHIELAEIDYGKTDPERIGTDIIENNNTADVIIPGIGIQYAINTGTQIFTGIHKGFSPPGTNDATTPEESINYELGTRINRTVWQMEATVFVNDYSNLLGSDLAAAGGDGTGDLFNAGKVLSKGIEFQGTFDVFATNKNAVISLPISLIYTFSQANFKSGFVSTFEDWGTVEQGDDFPYLANHQFTGIIAFSYRSLSAHAGVNYMSAMRMEPGQGEIPEALLIPARTLIDCSIQYQMHRYISVFASVLNAANNTYIAAGRPAGLRPGMPRTFNVGLKLDI